MKTFAIIDQQILKVLNVILRNCVLLPMQSNHSVNGYIFAAGWSVRVIENIQCGSWNDEE
jgi:hypothetical protein